MAVLAPLQELDEVAYLRFASVYRAFDDLEAFEAEIALLRAEHEMGGGHRLAATYDKSP
jgi:transcriptional repressor NrdR